MGTNKNTTIVERIRLIQELEGYKQKEFCEEVGISENTYKSCIKKNFSPGYKTLEKVITRWPFYTYWLMTGSDKAPTQITPFNSEVDRAKALLSSHGFVIKPKGE